MRKILTKIAILIALIVAIAALWIVGGRQLSLFVDRFKTIETASMPIKRLLYEGNGTGGTLHIDDLALSLTALAEQRPPPNVGTTKDEQLALSHGGKVFPFGPLPSGAESLVIEPPAGDRASISIRHSALSWPTPADFNFMTGHSPSWRRTIYYELSWEKEGGAKLKMLWRYEQYFYPGDGWAGGMMTREGSTGLIRVDIRS